MKSYWVYILTNKPFGVLYIGVTSDINRRMYEHKNGLFPGFTKRYKLDKLVYMEEHHHVADALQREKNLKHYLRQWKLDMIAEFNPEWHDLAQELSCVGSGSSDLSLRMVGVANLTSAKSEDDRVC